MKNIFKMFFPKKILGIDIGTHSIKVIELSFWGKNKTLENYGQLRFPATDKKSSSNVQVNNNKPSVDFIVKAIREILDQAHIKTKGVIFSVPDFSTFCTSFEMPQMPEKEIPGAIRYNASQYITLPISEVTLDWKIIPGSKDNKDSFLKVFLIAVPNQVIQEYQTIAKMAGLELYALEAEALAISRALVKDNKKTICLMDIGVQTSTINIIDGGFLKRSYSFNFNSNQLSFDLSSSLGISYDEAEAIKNKEGLISKRPDVVRTLNLLIDPLFNEIKNISAEFYQQEQRQIEEIYLSGGMANLPGLKEYLAEKIKKNIYIPNCFSGILHPKIIESTLLEMSPSFSAAVGAALQGLEI